MSNLRISRSFGECAFRSVTREGQSCYTSRANYNRTSITSCELSRRSHRPIKYHNNRYHFSTKGPGEVKTFKGS